ncbi:NACHT domain-containing protein, partial [Dichotomopilus funicola]
MTEKSQKKWLKWPKKLLGGRRTVSPAPSATSSTNVWSSDQGNTEHGLNTSSIVATESCAPPFPSAAAAAKAARPGTDARVPDDHQPPAASQALPPALPAESAPKPPPTESTEPPTPVPSVSERLWNEAYDSLETDNAELVESYVKMLETVLGANLGVAPDTNISAELHNPTKRQMYMRGLVEEGQAKISRASKITNGVGDIADFVSSVKGMIDLAVQSVPQAALPWAGVCVGLQILQNPAQATKSNLAGIAHIISRMDWYCALTEHLLNENNVADGKDFQAVLRQLKKGIVELYRALLQYQMKSVCSYYRNQGLVFLRGMLNLDDWDGDLKLVTDAEAIVQKDAAQSFQEQTKASLENLVEHAEGMERRLGDIHQDIRDFISLQKVGQDEKCLQDLFVVDPQDDMDKIQKKKDTLLDAGYNWILDTKEYTAFTNWNSGGSTCRLMWVKGHAGTGKTMLLMGIIRELSSQSAKLAPKVSYFFCQGTDQALNSATATLRSLIWLLLVQQPHLISHLRSKHRNAGSSLFEGERASIALSNAFKSMLKDSELRPVYFIIDALDECEEGLGDLIDLISSSLALSDKVKWLVSGRPTVELKSPETSDSLVELDAQKLKRPVNAYIDHKLSILKTREGYNDRILAQIKAEVRQQAKNTFLWVALVFRELDAGAENLDPVHGAYAVEIIKEIPSGLSELYDHIMTRIEKGTRKDPQHCKNVLVAATLAYRPLTLSEVAILAGLPSEIHPRTIAKKCGSFLTITGEVVNLIHQSAKDYLEKNFESRLQKAGPAQGHTDIGTRAIDAMSSVLKLKRNIYNLDYGFKPKDLTPPDPDPLAPIRYSCVFWVDHLCSLSSDNS